MKPARRRYSPRQLAAVIAHQSGLCACGCGEPLVLGEIDYDHDHSLWLDGPDTLENLRALIRKHHMIKTKVEAGIRAKCDRVRAKYEGRKLNARDREIARILDRP